MKVFVTIGIVVLLLVVILMIYLVHFGLFSAVKISKKNIGPYLLVYKKHVGDYKNVGPIMDALYYDLKENFKIETTKGFGLYYDNQKDVQKDKLRSIVGCIVENKSINEIAALGDKYGINSFPNSECIVAEFHYHGKMSIIIGVIRVYPKLSAYLKEHKYNPSPIMELYDQPNNKIEYISS